MNSLARLAALSIGVIALLGCDSDGTDLDFCGVVNLMNAEVTAAEVDEAPNIGVAYFSAISRRLREFRDLEETAPSEIRAEVKEYLAKYKPLADLQADLDRVTKEIAEAGDDRRKMTEIADKYPKIKAALEDISIAENEEENPDGFEALLETQCGVKIDL